MRSSSGFGLALAVGGMITNSGTATVINQGTLVAQGSALALYGGFNVTNGAAGSATAHGPRRLIAAPVAISLRRRATRPPGLPIINGQARSVDPQNIKSSKTSTGETGKIDLQGGIHIWTQDHERWLY